MVNVPHYFIAIPLPDSLKDYFSIWQMNLCEKVSYKQWPNKLDLHITLKFLGPVDELTLKKLHDMLHQVLERFEAFEIDVGQIGTFGKPNEPRVLWAGVEKSEQLTALQKMVEQSAQIAGFTKEHRAYRPHITLAKKWGGTPLITQIGDIIKDYKDMEMQKLHVDEVVIYRIFPNKNPKYEVVHRFRLMS